MTDLKLSRNIVFIKDYFYDEAGAKLDYENSVASFDDNANIFEAKWKIPAAPYIMSNIEILSESPYFGNLLDKKINFIHLLKTLPSNDTKKNLERMMTTIITSFLSALKNAHLMYWIDAENKIRSEFSLNYVLTQSCKLCQDQLKILNIIDETYLPKSIISIHAEDAFNDMVKNRKKEIGIDIANVLADNKKPKKPRKKTNKK